MDGLKRVPIVNHGLMAACRGSLRALCMLVLCGSTRTVRLLAPIAADAAMRTTALRCPTLLLSAAAGEDTQQQPPERRRAYDDEDVGVASDAAEALMDCPRAEAGREAFEGTTWSMLMRMNEGGSTIFTVQLLDDDTCRFSDSDLPGSWECQDEWVVIEKPKGFFDMTLFFSARLQPPTRDRPKWRLIDGVVQRSNHTETRKNATENEERTVEVVQIGSFGANEFEEALLVDMPRFQETERPSGAEDGEEGS